MLTVESKINTLSSQDQEFIDRLKNIDLEPIIFHLVNYKDTQWTLEQAEQVSQMYLGFLYLSWKYPNKAIVPSKAVDKFWHQHILDTQKYHQDCQMVFGYYVHHFPYFGMRGQEDVNALNTAFEETMALFNEHFGQTKADASTSLNKASQCLFEVSQAAECLFPAPQAAECLFPAPQAAECLFPAPQASECLFSSDSFDNAKQKYLHLTRSSVDLTRPCVVRQ